ncbi:MAG: SDR family oxidoreductase [Candidatus Binatia bacterium]
MNRIMRWLEEQFAQRPWWMNALMTVCAFLAFVYVPWDFVAKPIAEDHEIWLGVPFKGWAAKLTEPLHFLIYAAGAYGFWRMTPWMWPWAAVYTATVTFGMVLWPIVYVGGPVGWLLGIVSIVPFGAVTYALWTSRDYFVPRTLKLRERYGDWALVTGASAGIGAEFARALAREGISSVLVARRKARLTELAAELERNWNVGTRVVQADLTTAEGPADIAEAVADLEIGLLVNNAGVGYAGRFESQDLDRLRDMITLNCMAPVELTHRLVPPMIARGRGALVIVGSAAGRQPIPFLGVYSATKSFDNLLGEALWVELADRGIDVTVLMPGPVATEFESVAGEQRPDPSGDELPDACVMHALEALGRQPSVVSGGWMNWMRANVNRVLPRAVTAFVAAEFAEKQTPSEMR